MQFGNNGGGTVAGKANILGTLQTGVAGQTKEADSSNEAAAKRAELDDNAKADALDKRIDESKDLKPSDKQQTYTAEVLSDPSAKDLGIDVEEAQNANPVETVLAETAAANHGGSSDGFTTYSSHPIQTLHLGPYHFENSLLKLKGDQVGDFEKLLDLLPAPDRMNVKKLDLGRVDEIVAARQSAATQNFDSAAGRAGLDDLMKDNPRVGTAAIDGPTAHANVSQTDGNVEYLVGQPAEDEGNESE